MCRCKGKCGCNVTRITQGEKGESSAPYNTWRGLLNQSGTNAPVATVLQNELGGNIVWSYSSTGTYIGTLSGAFLQAKTFINIQPKKDVTVISAKRLTDNTIQVDTNNSNGVLDYQSLEILIYP